MSWTDLPKALGGDSTLTSFNSSLKSDKQLLNFINTTQLPSKPLVFGLSSTRSDSAILVSIDQGKAAAKAGSPQDTAFTLTASPQAWQHHFQKVPIAPYQSYWGLLSSRKADASVQGDKSAFARFAPVWRRALELLHDAAAGPIPEEQADDPTDDYVTGQYVYIDAPVYGRCKVLVEHTGDGRQPILFLHPAGTDSRVWHQVMNDRKMRTRCKLYAFDFPGQGRSFPGRAQVLGSAERNDDAIVGTVATVVKTLGLKRPIVVGDGTACLAVAGKIEEVGAAGVVPLGSVDGLAELRQYYDHQSPNINSEIIYGLLAPTAQSVTKSLLWHIAASQNQSVLHSNSQSTVASRLESISTAKCPVYMLTGEYDWSSTSESAQAAANKVSGAVQKKMEGLGHFPAAEDPKKFVQYMIDAIESIQSTRKGSIDKSVLRMTDD